MSERHHLQVIDQSRNNPCQRCPSSCCDPVKITLEEHYPLSVEDPRQVCKNSQVVEDVRKGIIEYVKEIISLGKPPSNDNRFRLHGFYIAENSENPLEQLRTKENVTLTAWNISICILYSCLAYNKTEGTCTRYETRPSMCLKYSSEQCGMDSLSRRIYTENTYEGRVRVATINFHDKVKREAKLSIDEAFEDFLANKEEVALFI